MKKERTNKMLAGVAVTIMALSLSGCSSPPERPPEPEDDDCDQWKWDDHTDTYQCDDERSHYRGFYFFGGRYFGSASALQNQSSYQKYRNNLSQSRSGLGRIFQSPSGG